MPNSVLRREQPTQASKKLKTLKDDSAIGQHLLNNPECIETTVRAVFRSLIEKGQPCTYEFLTSCFSLYQSCTSFLIGYYSYLGVIIR